MPCHVANGSEPRVAKGPMGLSAVIALNAPGKDQESLAKHFESYQAASTKGQDAGNVSDDEEDYNAYNFWRAPLPAAVPSPAPVVEEKQFEVRFIETDAAAPGDFAKLMHVDDEFREHFHMKVPVGGTVPLPSPIGRRWHVRSEQSSALLHSFTTQHDMPPVEVRARRELEAPELSLRQVHLTASQTVRSCHPFRSCATARLPSTCCPLVAGAAYLAAQHTDVPPLSPLATQRIINFEAQFQREHGRAVTPEDGPNLPKEVLEMYREHTRSLNMR